MQDRQSTLKQYLLPKEKRSQKRTSSQLNPSTEETTAKKVNIYTLSNARTTMDDHSRKENMNIMPSTSTTSCIMNTESTPISTGTTNHQISLSQHESAGTLTDQAALLKDIVGPLVTEVRELKDSVKAEYSKLEGIITNQQETINKLEATISFKQAEATSELTNQIFNNTEKLNNCIAANQLLQKGNEELKARLKQIELTQLGNNIITSGMQEQSWETYDTTKERVIDTIVTVMGGEDKDAARREARKIYITCCNRIGQYQLGRPRPISVTFQHQEDKDVLMSGKSNLPPGLYVNHEYPPHIKRNRDRLCPILRLAKSTRGIRINAG